MNKSIAVLAFVVAGQFSLAHASDGVKVLALLTPADQGRLNNSASEMATSDDSSEMMKGLVALADRGSGLHPTLTDDPGEFEIHVRPNHSLVEVDFASIAGQTAPLTVEGSNFAVGLNGDAQVLSSYQDLPPTYWFGDQAESTFVLANGSVQIVFPEDVVAVSLLTSTSVKEKLLPEEDRSIATLLLDANGNIMSEDRLSLDGGTSFLGILSDIPFRSVIISSTAKTWMFSNLNYDETEVSEMK